MDRKLIRFSLAVGGALALAGCSTYHATVASLGKTVDAVGDTLAAPPAEQPVPAVDLTNARWQKLSPEQPDTNPIRAAVVARDDKVGATRVVMKVPAAMSIPPYWFGTDGTYTVLKGTFVFETVDADGHPQKLMQSKGAFARVPSNLIQHASTRAGEEGLLYITVYGDWAPKFAEGAWGPKPQLRAGS